MIDRLMIVGPPKSGKSALAKALAGCLARTGRSVDLRDEGREGRCLKKTPEAKRLLLHRMLRDGLLVKDGYARYALPSSCKTMSQCALAAYQRLYSRWNNPRPAGWAPVGRYALVYL
jgi:hypothetical protein